MRFDKSQLQVLEHLNSRPEGQLLVEMLRGKEAELVARMRTATGEEVFRAQGRLQEVAEWITALTTASKALNSTPPTLAPRAFQR